MRLVNIVFKVQMMKVKFSVFVVVSMIAMLGQAVALSDQNRPEYKKEFDAYLRDLDIIAQTGKAPKNPVLEADLAKMSSEEKITLTALANTNIKTVQNNAKIVHSVEIVRVPEEFREQYAEMLKEQNKTISAQSLVDVRHDEQKKIAKDNSAAKVAMHINPFRFLKEVELSSMQGEVGANGSYQNRLVEAYFNQFGRPYVAADTPKKPVVTVQKAPQRKEKTENILNNLSLRNSMFVD